MLNRALTRSITHQGPTCRSALEGRVFRVFVNGDWTLHTLDQAFRTVEEAGRAPAGSASTEIDLTKLDRLDTAGGLALAKLLSRFDAAAFVNASDEHRILLDEVVRATDVTAVPPPRRRPILESIESFIGGVTAIATEAVRLTAFLGVVTAAIGRILAHPKRFRSTSFVHQIQQAGLNAVPIISLVCFLIGGVVMQQAAKQLRAFGAEALSIDMLGILSLREVGVLLCAVMVAGRSASAFTAQIGTMKMREEIDAMRTLGIDPIETLVVPRILALIIALPLLVFIADIMALAGGALMSKLYLGFDTPLYLQRLNSALDVKHFYVGMIKAPFAALIIGLVGCLEGLSVEGSAELVGTQVTTAVVKAIFLVLILDGVFAIFLSASGF